MPTRRKIIIILAIIVGLAVSFFLAHDFIYKPLKFQRLISKVESAKTAAEEREAFELAARGGRIWEINPVLPKFIPERARHLKADRLIELEWLESSPWNGQPYRAYRNIIDTNNLQILYVRYGK